MIFSTASQLLKNMHHHHHLLHSGDMKGIPNILTFGYAHQTLPVKKLLPGAKLQFSTPRAHPSAFGSSQHGPPGWVARVKSAPIFWGLNSNHQVGNPCK